MYNCPLLVLFGVVLKEPHPQGWQNGQRQLKVELSDRILLNPYAAKRLSIMFNNVVREYEKRFGELPIEPLGRAAGNA